MSDRYIEGMLHLTTPLHVSDHGEWRIGDDGYFTRANDPHKSPVTRTMRIPVVTTSGALIEVPYFPGNDFRGRIRSAAADIVIAALGPIPLELYHIMVCGADGRGQPNKATPLTVDEVRAARAHPFVGLFGGGPRMHTSGWSVRDGILVSQLTVDNGMVPAHLVDQQTLPDYRDQGNRQGDDAKAWAQNGGYLFTHVYRMLRIDRLQRLDLVDSQIDGHIIGGADAILAYQKRAQEAQKEQKEHNEKLREQRQARRENKLAAVDATATTEVLQKKSKSTLAAMMALEAMLPGGRLYFRLDLEPRVTPAQFGLLLQALVVVLNQQRLGGFVRSGAGRVHAKLDYVQRDDADRLQRHPVVRCTDAGQHQLVTTAPVIAAAETESTDWLAEIANAAPAELARVCDAFGVGTETLNILEREAA